MDFLTKLKAAIQKKDYYLLGKYSFVFVVLYSVWHVFFGSHGFVELIPDIDNFKTEWVPIFAIILDIAVWGIIPILFFLKHGLSLSKQERKEKKLVLFLPRYILLIYSFCLLVFVLFVLLPRIVA